MDQHFFKERKHKSVIFLLLVDKNKNGDDSSRLTHYSPAALGRGYASSQAEQQVDGAHICDVIVGQPPVVLHLFALVDEPLLAHLDSLPALHHLLEAEHGLVGFDVVGADLAFIVSEEHLDGGPLSDQ